MFWIVLLLSVAVQGCERHQDGYCYTLSTRDAVYEDARAECAAQNSTLLAHLTGTEVDLVLSKLPRTVWLAPELADLQQGETPRCPAFYPIQDKSVWQISCNTLLSYVCKKKSEIPTVAPPTTPPHSFYGCQTNPNPLENATLLAHNAKRSLHVNTPPLCWNWDLATTARAYAHRLCLMGGIDHDTINRDGENIYSSLWSETRDLAWYYQHAVKQWYNEIRHYDYAHPGPASIYGHFTQLVWRSSYLLGCGHGFGLNRRGKKRIVVVCRYSPRGSLNNHRLYNINVLPLKDV